MSVILYNDTGGDLYAYTRSNPQEGFGSPSWSSAVLKADGSQVYTSGGTHSGVGFHASDDLSAISDSTTEFSHGCWVNAGAHQSNPSQVYVDAVQWIKSFGSGGDCGSNGCEATLSQNGTWNNPLGITQCTDIQPGADGFKKSVHNVTATYIFDYNDTTRIEWNNQSAITCPDQMPLRISMGGAPALRGQGIVDGSFYKIKKEKTTQ